jgi:hypothetical protein
MEEGHDVPSQVEAPQCSRILDRAVVVLFLGYAGIRSFRLPCCSELDEVGNEQVGGNEGVEEQAGLDVGA